MFHKAICSRILSFGKSRFLKKLAIFCAIAGPAFSDSEIYPRFHQLDQRQISSIAGSKFRFDETGQMIDGPRLRPGGPIDFSTVVAREVLVDGFTSSVFGCLEGVRYCESRFFRLQGQEIQLLVISNSVDQSKDEALTALAFDETLGKFGFKRNTQEGSGAEILSVEIGNDQQLLEKARRLEDQYGVEFFELKTSSDRSKRESVDYLGSCYLSTRSRPAHQQTILVNPMYLKSCLPRLLVAAIGLNETTGLFPSITSLNRDYRGVTSADRTYFATLYSSEFPVDGGLIEVREFYLRQLASNSEIKSMLQFD